MKIIILGSGTSTGVPEIGCTCAVCTSKDPHDHRLRCSTLIEKGDTHILIDCGPDFREQIMHIPFAPISGVLVTHEHYDHVGGIDDLRPFTRHSDIPIYTEQYTADRLKKRMPYCFLENSYPGIPQLTLETVTPGNPFFIHDVEVLPIRIIHGRLPILGFRIGKMAYITDMKTLPEESYEALSGLDLLIMNALRFEPHNTHQSLEEALEVVEKLKPRETYFIHMSHQIGLQAETEKMLPVHVHFAYDGLELYSE